MQFNKKTIILLLSFYILFNIPLAAFIIIISIINFNQCDITDIIGLNLRQYLIVLGISEISISISASIALIMMLNKYYSITGATLLSIIGIFGSLFDFIWIIIGLVILIRSNIKCIDELAIYAILTLVLLFILTILTIIRFYHSNSNINKN